jgi:hypothetical protein
MWKLSYKYLVSLLLLALLTISVVLELHSVQAAPKQFSLSAQLPISSGTPFSAQGLPSHEVNMHLIPASNQNAVNKAPLLQPLLTTQSDVTAQLLQEAANNKNMPVSRSPYPNPLSTTQSSISGFPALSQRCCQPPDIALAASSHWILQAVNLQVAVYNPDGTLEMGWPKSLANFFGVPTPSGCGAKTPFITAPRASYDPDQQRFWLAAIEDEGLDNSCPFKSLLWVAVSQNNDPNGDWHIYTFNLASNTHNAARFTQFALDQQAIYFSANMYGSSGHGPFQYSEIFASLKAPLQAGKSDINYYGFAGQMVGTLPVDTVQPVQVQENSNFWLHTGLFINSFNIRNGGGHCVHTCSGIVIWSLSNPGRSNNVLTGAIVPSLSYALAPLANQPGCTRCFAHKSPPDTRISSTPIYHAGLISFALVTGIRNQQTILPGILWGQIAPLLNDDGSINSATIQQSGYFHFSNDLAALYPALAVNNAGDLSMVYDYTGSNFNPGTALTTRSVTFKHGRFHDGGTILHAGQTPTMNVYWGNYTATSYEGLGTDKSWFVGQFSNAQHNWATYIARP